MEIELTKIRNNAWLKGCLELSGSRNLSALYKKMDRFKDVAVLSKYKNAVNSPNDATLKAIDEALPGTAEIFLSGVYGLPLWALLDGDISACNEYVNEFLIKRRRPEIWMISYRKSVLEMSLLEKVQAIVEVSVPSEYFSKKRPVTYDDDDESAKKIIDLRFVDRSEYFYTFAELMKNDGNILARAYSESINPKLRFATQSESKDNFYSKFSHLTAKYGLEKQIETVKSQEALEKLKRSASSFPKGYLIDRPACVMAIFAAATLCVRASRIEGNLEIADCSFYLLNGIDEAIKNMFGEDIYAYIYKKRDEWDLLP